MPVAAILPFAIGAGTSLIGGIMGSNASKNAANTQAAAAEQAAQLQHQDAAAALDFQKQQYGNSLKMLSPYYGMGTNALNRLGFLMGMPQQNVTFDPNNPNGTPPPAGNGGGAQFDMNPMNAMRAIRARDPRIGGGGNISPIAADMTPNPAAAGTPGLARGGMVQGPGTPTSDSVPIRASKGEVVVNAAAARLPGVTEGLMRLNRLGDHLAPHIGGRRFATGGIVGGTNVIPPGGSTTLPGSGGNGISGLGGVGTNFTGGPGAGTTTIDPATNPAAAGDPNLSKTVNTGGGMTGTNFEGGPTWDGTPPGGIQSLGPTGDGSGFLTTPWTQEFNAPTGVTEKNDPGYQFRLQQGLDALQNSAAARGGLLSGGTAKAINDYAQGSASGEYGNVYNRAMGEYLNRYNIFRNNQNDLYNRFAGVAGLGQTSANQLINAGENSANNASNILLTSGGQIGQNINNAGAARASGYVGGANAIGGALSGIGNLAQLYSILHSPGITN